jgi:recombination protein RecR
VGAGTHRRFRGRYHVLGGTLSALDGVGPDELRIPQADRTGRPLEVREVILATGATVEARTRHYIAERLGGCDVVVSGSPMACRWAASSTTSMTAP